MTDPAWIATAKKYLGQANAKPSQYPNLFEAELEL